MSDSPPPREPEPPITPEAYRARQRSRAVVMGWLLGALVVLLFAISLAKIAGNLR